jgi:hypothetical protein
MDISKFKKGYQPRTNIVKDDMGGLVTDCHNILARRRNNFSRLLNVHEINVRHKEKHTAEPLGPDPSASEGETAIEKLKRHKSPGNDHIPA